MIAVSDPTQPGGHRSVPHTADLRVEAWGPTREVCLAQAVRGVCESFLDMAGAKAARGPTGARHREVTVRADTDEDLLVALLEEVVYWLDTQNEAPVEAELTPVRGGLRALLSMTDIGSLPVTGAAPKAVTLHGLSCGSGPDGWRCSVTLDV
ncbi:archease [Streptomyces sp. NPDC056149]|uniref:archease n=1 Tax=unclassified Streptomyces TaxID=2593676 RepID=UPI002380CF2D|nr:archease [Streptomyces sp. WZ-12]